MARSTKGLSSFAFGKVVTIRSSRAVIKEVARLRSIDMRCAVVRPSFLCALRCLITLAIGCQVRGAGKMSLPAPYTRRLFLFFFVFYVREVAGVAVASARARNRVALLVELHAESEPHAVQ